MRATQKVTSSEVLTKQTMRKIILLVYKKNAYIFKLLLNIDTTGTDTLVTSGTHFCIPASKKCAAC